MAVISGGGDAVTAVVVVLGWFLAAQELLGEFVWGEAGGAVGVAVVDELGGGRGGGVVGVVVVSRRRSGGHRDVEVAEVAGLSSIAAGFVLLGEAVAARGRGVDGHVLGWLVLGRTWLMPLSVVVFLISCWMRVRRSGWPASWEGWDGQAAGIVQKF